VMRCQADGAEWDASVRSLLGGSGCPVCGIETRAKSQTMPTEYYEGKLRGINGNLFLGWVDGHRGCKSKVMMRCGHGHEWSSTAFNVAIQGVGCPRCSAVYRPSIDERESQLKALSCGHFVGWHDGYKNASSMAVMRCDNDHLWSASVANLTSSGTGCPSCAQGGFKPHKPGFVYFLASDCGRYIKVGITNDHKRRMRELKNATPFSFSVAAKIKTTKGHDAIRIERFFHRNFERAGLSGFDGCTEWMISHKDILYMASMASVSKR
jgi:hypothetical protein